MAPKRVTEVRRTPVTAIAAMGLLVVLFIGGVLAVGLAPVPHRLGVGRAGTADPDHRRRRETRPTDVLRLDAQLTSVAQSTQAQLVPGQLHTIRSECYSIVKIYQFI